VGVLVPDEEANERLRNVAGARHRGFMFKIAARSVNVLREAQRPAGEQAGGREFGGL
jgi:hypothetical protein